MIKIYKFLLATIGSAFPLRRHPLGKLGNLLRCFFASRIVKSFGTNCNVERGAEIQEDCIIGDNAGIGAYSLISQGTIIEGDNMMGPNVHIYTNGHFYNSETHCFEGYSSIKPVVIGKHTWIGYGVIILPGVKIGSNTIIGAGSVVTKDIPSGVMAAGNPCIVKKVIDKFFYDQYVTSNNF